MRSRRKIIEVAVKEPPWEDYPAGGQCSVCGGLQRITPSGPVCRKGHGGAPTIDHSVAWSAEKTPTPPTPPTPPPVSKTQVALALASTLEQPTLAIERTPAPRVQIKMIEFESAPLARFDLVDLDLMTLSGEPSQIEGALVRVDVELRPSERASFDASRVRSIVSGYGARGMSLLVRPVSESSGLREPTYSAPSIAPEAAVTDWFAAVPNVPDDERKAALELSLELLEKVSK